MTNPITPTGRDPIERVWSRLEMEAEIRSPDQGEVAFRIGVRDGFSEAVQLLDMLTGGDGEYRYCTDHDPDRHCPTPVEMGNRIVERIYLARLEGAKAMQEACAEWLENGEDQAAEDLCVEVFDEFRRQRADGTFVGHPFMCLFAAAIRSLDPNKVLEGR